KVDITIELDFGIAAIPGRRQDREQVKRNKAGEDKRQSDLAQVHQRGPCENSHRFLRQGKGAKLAKPVRRVMAPTDVRLRESDCTGSESVSNAKACRAVYLLGLIRCAPSPRIRELKSGSRRR